MSKSEEKGYLSVTIVTLITLAFSVGAVVIIVNLLN